ncbi:MAG: branched-chain amino acid ABC transporter permease [Nitrospirae bacterium]|nr:branched-chain amino acid ABC transporter permease [Nitrospirota bacterium]
MDLVTHYQQDLRLLRRPWHTAVFALALACLSALPFAGSEYVTYLASLVLVYAIGIVGQNLLIGFAGQISMGQVGFLAVGAYVHAHATRAGIPFVASLLLTAGAGAIAGALVGLPSLRLKGPYLAIATLGFGIAAAQMLSNWEWLSGGRMGLTVPRADLPGFDLPATTETYLLTLAVALGLIMGAYSLGRSYVGRAFVAIRESEVAAEVLGIHLTKYKVLAFVISSAYTAVHGALWGQLLGYLEPQMFTFMESVYMLAAVIIGGVGSVAGSVLGAAFVTLVPQVLSGYRELIPILFGIVIILVMLFEPLGLYGRWIKARLYVQNFPFR